VIHYILVFCTSFIGFNTLAESALVASEFSEDAFKSASLDSEEDSLLSAEFGASLTSGNTDTQTYTGKLQGRAAYSLGRLSYHGEFLKKISADTVSADKWKVGIKSNLDFSEHTSSFVTLEHEQDEFASYTAVTTFAAGYTQLMFNDSVITWDADIGPGYKYKTNQRDSLQEYVMHLGTNLSIELSEQAQLIQTLIADIGIQGDASDVVRSETALLTSVLENLKMKLTYAFKHNDRPGENKEKLDTQTTVSMVFIF